MRNIYQVYRETSMPLQHRFPFLPPDAEILGPHAAVSRADGHFVVFNASGPIYRCREDDALGRRLAAALLTDPALNLAKPKEVGRVLGWHRSRVHDYRKRYQEQGVEGLEPQRTGPRGPHKLKDATLSEAQQLLHQGLSNRQVAAKVGVSEGAIRAALREGRLVGPLRQRATPVGEQEATTPRQRNAEDLTCPAGVAVKRTEDRALAHAGLLVEAEPVFEPAQAVAKAGVLVALAALLGQGLIDVGREVYGAVKNGYFGLSSMLLTFAFMALLRIKTLEGLPAHAPGEFGSILGLDRAPEIRTARRKLAELGARGQGWELAGAFAARWAEDDPEALGYLYVDGHVRPYHGRTHRLPKTYVQRRRLCMPATTDYWVNDARAEPLFFVTAPANDDLLKMLESEVLPEVRELAGPERRITVIFDREGWSPQTFATWHQRGIDVLTYRKGAYEPWPEECFFPVESTVSGRPVTYQLGQRSVRLARDFWMREVRRLCDDGHQTAVMTTRQDLEVEEVARRMFARWSQENFFRYMRHEFDLDHLPSYRVEPADPQRSVPNPAIKEKKRELEQLRAQLAKAQREYGEKALDNPERQRPTMRGFKIAHGQIAGEIRRLRARCEELAADVQALPKRLPIRQLFGDQNVIRLEQQRKVITDTVKMVAYRAETQLANLVGPLLPYRSDEARSFLKKVFQLPADLLPDPKGGRLVVRIYGMANPRSNRALAALCEVLNQFEVTYPGTALRLVLEAPQSR
jgi:transposase